MTKNKRHSLIIFGSGLLALALIFVSQAAIAESPHPTPFSWTYDLNFQRDGDDHLGVATYTLEPQPKRLRASTGGLKTKTRGDYVFSILLKTNRNEIKSTSQLVLKHDASAYVVPLERQEKFVVYGIPLPRKRVAITPTSDRPYYDDMSATLLLLKNVRKTAMGESKARSWRIWMADDNEWANFKLARETERVSTPIGELDSYTLERVYDNPNKSFKVWIARDGGYLVQLVKVNPDETLHLTINKAPLKSVL